MKKKKTILIIIGILLLIICYFVYKGFHLFYYNVNTITTQDYETFARQFTIKDTLTLHKRKIPESEYLEYLGIKIKNDFKDFRLLEPSTGNSRKYILDKDSNEAKISFWLGTADTYTYLLKEDKTIFGDNKITNTNLTNILKSNHINNDIELMKYLSKQQNIKNNIFTSVKKMKENYAIQFMVAIIMPQISHITLIDGDYKGFIFNMNNMKEVSIIKNNKRYVFMFMNTKYFTDDYIKNLLETVIIK